VKSEVPKGEYEKKKPQEIGPLKDSNEELPPCPTGDPKAKAGVLLSDEIERYAKKFELIDKENFNKEFLKPAGYRLTIGSEYAIDGKIYSLIKGKNEAIIIPPFQCAILSTTEKINLPRFLIGRWNLRVSLVYKGLLWLGGAQVDPGWYGHLYCPIFNLSNKEVELKLGEPFALIDFVATTPFSKLCKEYIRPPKRRRLPQYETGLKSALFTGVGDRIDKIEDKLEKNIDKFQDRLNSFISTNYIIISVIVTVLSILIVVMATPPLFYLINILTYSCLIFSIAVFIFTLRMSRKLNKFLKK